MPDVVRTSIGPICRNDLPRGDHARWKKLDKAKVVLAVQHGLISRTDALSRYRMADEEFQSWCDRYAAGDYDALQESRIPLYRSGAME
jgi:hypothetical protein